MKIQESEYVKRLDVSVDIQGMVVMEFNNSSFAFTKEDLERIRNGIDEILEEQEVIEGVDYDE